MTTSERRARPKIGLFLQHWDGFADGAPAPRWTDIQAMAREAEDAGFDSLWLADHLVMHMESRANALGDFRDAADPLLCGVWEAWSLIAALAAVTRRVELGHLVICNSFRNPALLAKMADTVDEISGGRLILGLGAGWHEFEYRAFGFPFDHRVSRFEEGLQIIHGLLKHGEIDFEGTYYSARECELRPRGPRPGGPPILIGTDSPRMLHLTARYADMWNGWIPAGRSHAEEVAPLRRVVDAACADVGRDPATLTRTLGVGVTFPGPAPSIYKFGEPIRGSTEEVASALWSFAEEGISHLMLVVGADNRTTVVELGRVIELMAPRVLDPPIWISRPRQAKEVPMSVPELPHAARTRPMKIGVILPTFEGALDGDTPRWSDMLTFAQRAEEYGVDSLWVIDHLLRDPIADARQMRRPVPPSATRWGVWECWSLMAALATAISRVELGTIVTNTGLRNPALLAKIADTVDEISGGRLILGVGAGFYEAELRAFGLPEKFLVSRFEEAISIVSGLLRDGRIDFQGRFYSARECELRPRGPRPAGPPILIGSNVGGPRMVRLMAMYADLQNTWLATSHGVSSPDQVPPLRATLDAACRELGREPASLLRTAGLGVDLPGQLSRPGTTPISGSPEEIAAALRAFSDEGISHVQLVLRPLTLRGLEAFAAVLEELDR